MKPPPFRYFRPTSVDEALAALAELGDDAKVLAGGQSLVPLLNFRLAGPDVLVDVGGLDELAYVRRSDGGVAIGATTRQRDAELSDELAATCPLLRQALRFVGHLQIRHRGTVGGSLVHADPAAELPAVAVALDAELVVRGPDGERVVPAREFFDGPFMTVVEPDALLMEARFPVLDGARTAFHELAQRSGDFALGGVAVMVRLEEDSGTVAQAGMAALGMGGRPVRLAEAEAALVGSDLGDEALGEAAAAASREVAPLGDIHADEQYRRELVATLLVRALRDAAG